MSEHEQSGITDGRDDDGAGRDGGRPGPRTVAEWTTLAVSAVVVLLLVGAVLAEMVVRDEPDGAVLTIEALVGEVETRDGQTLVPFRVRNDGGGAASAVVAIIEFRQGDTVVEDATIDIDVLGSRELVEGEVVTSLDLATHTVEARIVSMQDP